MRIWRSGSVRIVSVTAGIPSRLGRGSFELAGSLRYFVPSLISQFAGEAEKSSGPPCLRSLLALVEEEIERVSRWQGGSSLAILSALARPGEPYPTFLVGRTRLVREQIWD